MAEEGKILQLAQKCAWCGKYLFTSTVEQYNGPDKRYSDWMVHPECNLCVICGDSDDEVSDDSDIEDVYDTSVYGNKAYGTVYPSTPAGTPVDEDSDTD